MRQWIAAVCLTLAWGVSAATVQEGAPASVWSGVFSEAQAKRGEEAYQASCAGCHGQELVSVDSETPSLTGPRFTRDWAGKTLGERFERLQKTMPPTDPSSVDDQAKLDIIAYVLKFNGYPAGTQELLPDSALQKIVVEKPKGK